MARQPEIASADKAQRTDAQKKMDSALIDATRAASGPVLVDIKTADANATADFIRARGGTVVSSLPDFGAVRANVPIGLVEAIAQLPAVTTINSADIGRTN